MANRAQMEQLKLKEFNFEVMDFTTLSFNTYAGITLTGYHAPGPIFFSSESSSWGQLFQCKTLYPGSTKRNKIPTAGHNLPSSNANISMKKKHNKFYKSSFFPNFPSLSV